MTTASPVELNAEQGPRQFRDTGGDPTGAAGWVDLTDSRSFADGVPHAWFAHLRQTDPVSWHPECDGPGFWAITRHADCVAVNRDAGRFSSERKATFIWEMPEELLAQHRLMMVNMDPPLHTRYRRLVNKGFTPRTVNELEARIHEVADDIIDRVCERGSADFVTEVSSELPLIVLAELLGVPQEDHRRMFDWSNSMIGREDDEFGGAGEAGAEAAQAAAMELYAYAAELFAAKRAEPGADLMSVLATVEIDGERISELELELFFLLLSVAGNETTRNLLSGAMVAFSEYPDQWERLRADRSLLPSAVEEMLRYVSPVMNFRRQATEDCVIGGQPIVADDKVVMFHVSANRDESVFSDPERFDVARQPNPHMAFGGGGPHFCLGANLARVEIRVMFEHLLDRLPDLRVNGPVEHLQSNFINGVRHLPVTFTPSPPVGERRVG